MSREKVCQLKRQAEGAETTDRLERTEKNASQDVTVRLRLAKERRHEKRPSPV